MTTILWYVGLSITPSVVLLVAGYHIITRILRGLKVPDPDRTDPDDTVWIQWLGDGPPAVRPRRRRPVKRPTVRADEYDAVSRWRHRLRWRTGERAGIKTRLNRRYRRTAKHHIRRGQEP